MAALVGIPPKQLIALLRLRVTVRPPHFAGDMNKVLEWRIALSSLDLKRTVWVQCVTRAPPSRHEVVRVFPWILSFWSNSTAF